MCSRIPRRFFVEPAPPSIFVRSGSSTHPKNALIVLYKVYESDFVLSIFCTNYNSPKTLHLLRQKNNFYLDISVPFPKYQQCYAGALFISPAAHPFPIESKLFLMSVSSPWPYLQSLWITFLKSVVWSSQEDRHGEGLDACQFAEKNYNDQKFLNGTHT